MLNYFAAIIVVLSFSIIGTYFGIALWVKDHPEDKK